MKKVYLVGLILLMVTLSQCRKAELFPEDGYNEELSGGIQTSYDFTSKAFTNIFDGLSEYDESFHDLGDVNFEQSFVTAPAPINSGLGPAYNSVSCITCHHNDGRGIPTTGADHSSMLMRISLPGQDFHGGALEVPGYGTQLQDKAVFGKLPECKVNISYTYQSGSFADGEPYELRSPTYTLSDLYLPISGAYMLSPRLSPPVFGLGLLESIAEADIVANADVNDANSDGISGRPNYVWDPLKNSRQLGRFGLKANTASIITQVAAAYNNDMGVTSSIFPLETIHGQSQMDNLIDDYEIPDSVLYSVAFYIKTLKVPARRNTDDEVVKKGKSIFINSGCAACHKPIMYTKVDMAFPTASNQRIQPFSDLLLHDMGPGLADDRPDFEASGREWRTTPLWGLGMNEIVNYPAYYLHDGRARTITEAILWHGGEATNSVNQFTQLSKSDRIALLKFLKSL
jgi:CxxC motif-containing protein (DUF1111 family)